MRFNISYHARSIELQIKIDKLVSFYPATWSHGLLETYSDKEIHAIYKRCLPEMVARVVKGEIPNHQAKTLCSVSE